MVETELFYLIINSTTYTLDSSSTSTICNFHIHVQTRRSAWPLNQAPTPSYHHETKKRLWLGIGYVHNYSHMNQTCDINPSNEELQSTTINSRRIVHALSPHLQK